jgi:linoleoyl-CoA desaturase
MLPSENITVKSTGRSLKFTQQRDFRKTLNERVNTYLHDNSIPARDLPGMYIKTAVALAWWLGTYLLLLLGHFPAPVNVVLCVVWALAVAAVGFNVMHDASHDAFSANPRINKLFCLSGEMLGMSGFRWRTKHTVWHHTYTNISGYDDDVETYGIMRLTPRAPWKPMYRAQAWYFPLMYCLIGFDFIMRDFMMVLVGKSDANHVYPKMRAADKAVFWGGFNLGLVMRHLIGSGTPRGLQDRLATVIVMLLSLIGATCRWFLTISASQPIMAAAHPVTSPTTTIGDFSAVTTYTTGC